MKYIKFHYIFFMTTIIFTQTTPLDQLRTKYAWPDEQPLVNPDPESLFSNGIEMKRILNKNMKLIIELGSWLGASTRFILDHAPNATVIAIDHWKGSIEHAQDIYWHPKLSTLYETFLVNCWRYKTRLIPLKASTLEGFQELAQLSLEPDLIYLDAAHDFDGVTADLEMCYQVFPNALLVGDDWSWPTVRKAVQVFAAKYNLSILADDKKNFWHLCKQ